MDRKLLFSVEYPDYIRQFQLSEKRRALYYEKGGKHPLPGYTKGKEHYIWKKKNGKLRLFDTRVNEFVVRNKQSAGKPKFMTINAQHLYNQGIHFVMRAKMIGAVKDHLRPNLLKMRSLIKQVPYPIQLEGELFDQVNDPMINGKLWDLDNRQGVYVKAFHDLLQELHFIPDDNIKYVTKPLSFTFSPGAPKMVIRIYHDLRKEVQLN